MPTYMIRSYSKKLPQFMKDSLIAMKRELKNMGFIVKKHEFGYYEIYDNNNEQIGLIDNYYKYCKTIYKMNSYK